MRILGITLLAYLLVFTGNARAGRYIEYGSGVNSCGSWVKWRETTSGWHQGGQWVQGFVSAAGYYGKDLDDVDSDAMLLFMDSYCQSNPLNLVSDGAKSLVEKLKTKSTE